jgi:hypothetical protein
MAESAHESGWQPCGDAHTQAYGGARLAAANRVKSERNGRSDRPASTSPSAQEKERSRASQHQPGVPSYLISSHSRNATAQPVLLLLLLLAAAAPCLIEPSELSKSEGYSRTPGDRSPVEEPSVLPAVPEKSHTSPCAALFENRRSNRLRR